MRTLSVMASSAGHSAARCLFRPSIRFDSLSVPPFRLFGFCLAGYLALIWPLSGWFHVCGCFRPRILNHLCGKSVPE